MALLWKWPHSWADGLGGVRGPMAGPVNAPLLPITHSPSGRPGGKQTIPAWVLLEEKIADHKLTEIAQGMVNDEALRTGNMQPR